jgi:hypothetical protein
MDHKYVHQGRNLTVTLTFQDMLEAIQERRPCSRASLRRYIRKLHIRPLDKMQTSPRRYSPEAPAKILDALGEKVVTMQQLRAVKRQAQKARAA